MIDRKEGVADRTADGQPRVFISYSQDSRAHRDRVRHLADRLVSDGVDVHLDQYEEAPTQGWPQWMREQVAVADHVVAVCTETYRRRFEGAEAPGRGLGATWEGAILTQALYEAAGRNEHVIPVVFDRGDLVHVPAVLQPTTRYVLEDEDGYERLYRRLTNQPAVRKPPLGNIRVLAEDVGPAPRTAGGAVAPITPAEAESLTQRACALVPGRARLGGLALCVAVAAGPQRAVLRPAELERAELSDAIAQLALFGPHAVLAREEGTRPRREGQFVALVQERAGVLFDAEASVSVLQAARAERSPLSGGSINVVIEEELGERTERALGLIADVLDRLDADGELLYVAPVAAVLGGRYSGWRTRAEEAASPTSWALSNAAPERAVVVLSPAARPRAALRSEAARLAEDFVVLLRREWKP